MERIASGKQITLDRIASAADLLRIRDLAPQVHLADKVRRYIVNLVFASRQPQEYRLKQLRNYIAFGASPRASINLEKTARINAMLCGRTYVTPQDVKDVAHDVLRHRILLTYEAEAEDKTSDDIIEQLLATIEVP